LVDFAIISYEVVPIEGPTTSEVRCTNVPVADPEGGKGGNCPPPLAIGQKKEREKRGKKEEEKKKGKKEGQRK